MKVSYFQKFYYLHSECFYTEPGNNDSFQSYMKVIPVYVYSINKNWDGEETFDICPIDYSKESKTTSWKWRCTKQYKEIGKEVFNTKEEALVLYNYRYPIGSHNIELADIHKKQLREKKLEELLKTT